MLLTHLAFVTNTIPVFYNILKCLQILRRFYVTGSEFQILCPYYLRLLSPKLTSLIVGTSRLKFIITTNRTTCFSLLKNFIHAHGVDIINRFVNFSAKTS